MLAYRIRGAALSPLPFRFPLGPALQEDGSGLVGEILRDQTALKGALQDGLAEGEGVPLGHRDCPARVIG